MRDRRVAILAAGVGVVAACLYLRALDAPFIYDDHHAIVENRTIRDLTDFGTLLRGPPQSTLAGRPAVSASLALNYALGRLDPRGYRGVNIALHALCAATLVALVAMALRPPGRPDLAERYRRARPWLAAAVGLLWAVHPLLSETVVYVVQRTELLMAACYLLTLAFAARGFTVEARSPAAARDWFVAAAAACAVGMASKEVMVSTPLAVLLYDRALVSGSFAAALRRHRWLYASLASTWLVLLALNLGGPRSETAGFGTSVAVWPYLISQAQVLVHYLRLSLWPAPLTITYDWPIATSLREVLPHGTLVLALLALTAWALWRRPAAALPAAIFFMVLAPTTSLIPIATEVAAERRMYLPLGAVVALAVLGGHALLAAAVARAPARARAAPAAGGAAVAALAAALALGTLDRLADYRTEVSIWRAAVAVRPRSATARTNLGLALAREGRTHEAIAQYEHALALGPARAETLNVLGAALLDRGRTDAAVLRLRQALAADPTYAPAAYNLGNALARAGDLDAAARAFERAVEIDPAHALAWMNLGNTLLARGRAEEAITAYERALAADPRLTAAHLNKGFALASLGRRHEAGAAFRAALELQPDHPGARAALERLSRE